MMHLNPPHEGVAAKPQSRIVDPSPWGEYDKKVKVI